MKKYISLVLGAALAFMSSVDAYIFERDIAYTTDIMKGMDANFVDAFVLWRGDFIGKMRKKGNIKLALHDSGRSLIDATNEGSDAVMRLLVALFPSNSGTLEISTTADSNFAKAMQSLSVKTQARVIAKLLNACKAISNTSNINEVDIKQLSKQVSDQIVKMIDWNVITREDGKLSAVRDAIRKMIALVCASSVFERRVEVYKKHITESLILGFCCFNFDGLVGVRTLLNAFAEEGLIDSLDYDLQDVTPDMYLENMKKLIADYKKDGNIDSLLAECEATDLFEPWMSYEKFQNLFEGIAGDIKGLQKKLSDLKNEIKSLKGGDQTILAEKRQKIEELNAVLSNLIGAKVPELNFQLRSDLTEFFRQFNWNEGANFAENQFWKKRKFDKLFGNKISRREFIDFCEENRNDSEKIFSKIIELRGKRVQLPILDLLAHFYSNYGEKLDGYMAELEPIIRDYTVKREKVTRLFQLKELIDRTPKILSAENLLVFSAGKPSSIVPYPNTGDFEQNLDVKVNGKKFADCVETTIRHLVSMMCEYDSKQNRINVPDNFNELTKRFFDGYKDKVAMFNARSTELHTAWAEMLYNIPNFVDVERSGTGDLVSSSKNIKNVLAFLTSRNQAEYEEQMKKNLIDILNSGRSDVSFTFKGSSNKSTAEETTVVLQKKVSESENEEFSFVLSVCSGHSCLKGSDSSSSSTFAYEISDISNDTGRLYVSSLCFPNPAGELSLEYAQKDIERPWMNYFLEKPILSYGIDEAAVDILSKIRADIGNEDCANWFKSMIETNIERSIVSVAQTAVDDTSNESIISIVRRVTDKIRKNPLSVSAPNIIADEIIDEIINSLQIDKTAVANIVADACSQTINAMYPLNSFKRTVTRAIRNIEGQRSFDLFNRIINYKYGSYNEYDVKSATFTEENLKNCGVDVSNASTIIAACNVIKAVVISAAEYTPVNLDDQYDLSLFVTLDQIRQNYSELYECIGTDLRKAENAEKVIRGYLIEISGSKDNAKPKLLSSLLKFVETLESSSERVVISASKCSESSEEASLFIGLNQVKRSDAKLFEALNKVLALKVNGNEISLTDKTCSKLFLAGYLYDLANSKPALFSKFKSEMAELVNKLEAEKIEISLFSSGVFGSKRLERYANFILASLKLIENDSDLLEKLENVLVLKNKDGDISIKSALSRYFGEVINYLGKSKSESNAVENLRNIAGAEI